MEPASFEDGETIVRQGNPEDDLYTIVEETALVLHYRVEGDEPVEVGRLGQSNCFSEIALLLDQHRTALPKVHLSVLNLAEPDLDVCLDRVQIFLK